jgi:hypothetical protein
MPKQLAGGEKSPEIIPPGSKEPIEVGSSRAIVRKIFIGVSAAFLFSVVLWCLNQFLSLRGVVNVVASRIVLGFMWLAGAVLVLLGAKTLPFIKRRQLAAMLGSLFWILGVVALDWWAPKPPLREPDIIRMPTQNQDTFLQITVDPTFPLLTPNKTTNFNIGFFNNGSFPARNVFSVAALKISNSLSEEIVRDSFGSLIKELDDKKKNGLMGVSLSPHERKWNSYGIKLSAGDVKDIYRGKQFMYIVADAKWASSIGTSEEKKCIWLQPPEHRPLRPEEIIWHTCEGALQAPSNK